MRKVIGIVVLLVVAYALVQIWTMIRTRGDLEEFVERTLDSVDESSKNEVKSAVIAKAQKLGITVAAGDINVVYEDADTRTVAQRMVGRHVNAQFKNKRVVISLRYVVQVAGFQVPQQISVSRIRQVAAQFPTGKALQELLDTP